MDRISILEMVNSGNGTTASDIAKILKIDEVSAIELLKVMITEKSIRTMECGTLLDSAGLSSTATVVGAAGTMSPDTRFFMTLKGKALLVLGSYLPDMVGSLYTSVQSRIGEQKALPPAKKDDDIVG
jgi:hypothetical protein